MEINLKGISVFAHHGVYQEEKQNGQEFIIDAVLELDDHSIGDQLIQTADYAQVASDLKTWAESERFDLIETIADTLATRVLDRYDAVSGTEITVHKPFAPMPFKIGDASVTAKRQRTVVYLGLGSNQGDRQKHLNVAVDALKAHDGVTVTAVSSYINTPPYGVTDQPDFLNACIAAVTYLTPRELLALAQALEAQAGRVRTRKWGERTLDVDILLYGDRVISTASLTVPHPDMHNRFFVLEPLNEIAPYALHPLSGKRISQLREELNVYHARLL